MTPDKLLNSKYLRFLGNRLMHRDLWSIDKMRMAKGAALGVFLCWVPIPFQMLPGIVLAALLKVNLPLTLLGVWASNPLTWLPMLVLAYYMGYLILSPPENYLSQIAQAESLYQAINVAPDILSVILLGAFVLQIVTAAAAYGLVLGFHDSAARLVRAFKGSTQQPKE